MILSELNLINFRNYDEVKIKFFDGINYIVGDNATGKTNLVEAIYYLSLGRSFKTNNDVEIIKEYKDYSLISAKVIKDQLENNLEITISKLKKKILINNSKIKRTSELLSCFNVILFTPIDTNLMKESPQTRRFFMNLSLTKINKSYKNNLMNYERLLKERNLELKKDIIDVVYFNVLTGKLIDLSYEIFIVRKAFFYKINQYITKIYKEITHNNNYLKVKYNYLLDETDFKANLRKMYNEALHEDQLKKVTTIGVHKEDFTLLLNNKDIAKFGSQGQNRLAVLSLKLALYYLSDEGDEPIIILDDILSELDENHEKSLLELLKKFKQVFITTCKENENIVNPIFKVKDNKIYLEG